MLQQGGQNAQFCLSCDRGAVDVRAAGVLGGGACGSDVLAPAELTEAQLAPAVAGPVFRTSSRPRS